MLFCTSKCQKSHHSITRALPVYHVGMTVLRKLNFLHYKDILSSCASSTLVVLCAAGPFRTTGFKQCWVFCQGDKGELHCTHIWHTMLGQRVIFSVGKVHFWAESQQKAHAPLKSHLNPILKA